MTPAALSTYRDLRSLGLPAKVWRKVAIAANGRPCFAALDDAEFDEVLRVCRRVWPGAWQVPEIIEPADPAQGGEG